MTNEQRYNKARAICQVVKSNGGRAYLVGGFVRDRLLKVESKDIDIEVFGLQPDELEYIFSEQKWNLKLVGKSFGCYHSEDGIDITLPRCEALGADIEANPHTNFTIKIDPNMTVLKAAARRDLTINAIYYNPLTRNYIDPYHGIDDMRDGILRAVSSYSFADDPLRILRVAQFMARFNFDVHPDTTKLCMEDVEWLDGISKERVLGEITKLLMQANTPSIGFEWLFNIGALDIILPSIARLHEVHDKPKHHLEESVLRHTLLSLDVLPIEQRSLDVMLAILYHDAGKGLPDYPHHCEFARELPAILEKELTTETNLIKSVQSLVLNHSFHASVKLKDVTPKVLRRLSIKVDLVKLCKVMRADAYGRIPGKAEFEQYQDLVDKFLSDGVNNKVEPIILGRHLIKLGVNPGPEMGKLLAEIYNAQLDGEFDNETDGLRFTWDLLRYEKPLTS